VPGVSADVQGRIRFNKAESGNVQVPVKFVSVKRLRLD
jgi:hypothetical protein